MTTRTIKRDLAALEAGGPPIWGRTGLRGGDGLAEITSLPPVNLTAAQALALNAAVAAGRWLLVAWCRLRDDVRWFALHRVQRATATRTPCTGRSIDDIGEPPVTARPVGG